MNILSRQLQLIALAFVLVLAPHFLPSTAIAQDSQPSIVLGVVDFDLIMNESAASKKLKAEYESRRASLDKKYQTKLKEFRSKEQALAKQKGTLSEEDFKAKVEALDADGKKIEKELTDERRNLETNLNKALAKIRKTLIEISTGIATKRGMTLVLNKANIILAAEGFDFTDEAMKQLNAKLPSVKL